MAYEVIDREHLYHRRAVNALRKAIPPSFSRFDICCFNQRCEVGLVWSCRPTLVNGELSFILGTAVVARLEIGKGLPLIQVLSWVFEALAQEDVIWSFDI